MQRNSVYDIIRILGTFWIVGFWHLSQYIGIDVRNETTSYITFCFMIAFFFLSGLLINKHKKIGSFIEANAFLKKRFFNFFLPFVISAVTLYPCSYFDSFKQLLLTIFGLSAFSPPMVGTLWFSSLLLLFSYIGFAFLFLEKRLRVFASIILTSVIILMSNILNFDSRLPQFIIVFLLGLVIEQDSLLQLKAYSKYIAIVGVLICVSCFLSQNAFINEIGCISFVFAIIMLLSWLMKSSPLSDRILSIIKKIGISCSFAYFFHRQYYIVVRAFFKKITGEEFIYPALSYFVLLPIFFILCYYSTIIYQKFISNKGLHNVQE